MLLGSYLVEKPDCLCNVQSSTSATQGRTRATPYIVAHVSKYIYISIFLGNTIISAGRNAPRACSCALPYLWICELHVP